MAPSTGFAGSQDELLTVLREFADIGTDEVHLIPTSSDIGQLRAAADVVEGLRRSAWRERACRANDTPRQLALHARSRAGRTW